LSGVGPAVKVGAITLRITGIAAGLPTAPVEVTATEPLNVPAVVRPAVLIETLMEDGTVPPGVTDSHDPPETVDAEVVKLMPTVPEIFTGCAVGAVPPMV
jgi:hypothetical protein